MRLAKGSYCLRRPPSTATRTAWTTGPVTLAAGTASASRPRHRRLTARHLPGSTSAWRTRSDPTVAARADAPRARRQPRSSAWEFLDLDARAQDEDHDLLEPALTSRHHWRAEGAPQQSAISDWMVARGFAESGTATCALRFARPASPTAPRDAPAWLARRSHEGPRPGARRERRRTARNEAVERAAAGAGDEERRPRARADRVAARDRASGAGRRRAAGRSRDAARIGRGATSSRAVERVRRARGVRVTTSSATTARRRGLRRRRRRRRGRPLGRPPRPPSRTVGARHARQRLFGRQGVRRDRRGPPRRPRAARARQPVAA